MTEPQILEYASSPDKIISSTQANLVLSYLTGKLSDLRLEVFDLELNSDLFKNQLLRQEGKTDKLKESEWRISEPYLKFKKQHGLLMDLRALKRNVERRYETLVQQEKYTHTGYGRVI